MLLKINHFLTVIFEYFKISYMPRWVIPLILVFIIVVTVEFYTFQAFKTISKNKWVRFSYLAISAIVYIQFLITVFSYDRSNGQTPQFQTAMGILITFSIPKLVIILFLFGEDIYRWVIKLISIVSNGETESMPSRRKFISQLALGIAAIPFVSFIYGIVQGKYNFKVIKYQLSFDDLPPAFDGYTITQISDIHSGSFTNREKFNMG